MLKETVYLKGKDTKLKEQKNKVDEIKIYFSVSKNFSEF